MRRLAVAGLSGGLIAGIVACSGTTPAAPSPHPPARVNPSARVTSSPGPASTGLPENAVATDYYRAIAARNYQLAFTYLAPGATGPSGRGLTWQTFLRLARMLDGAGGPVTRFSAGVFQSLVVMTVEREKYGPYHAHLRMTRDHDGWAIASIDRL